MEIEGRGRGSKREMGERGEREEEGNGRKRGKGRKSEMGDRGEGEGKGGRGEEMRNGGGDGEYIVCIVPASD